MLVESQLPESERKCPRCGTTFGCGFQAGQATCWCFEFPRIINAQNSSQDGCLCPNCLRQQIETIQQNEANS